MNFPYWVIKTWQNCHYAYRTGLLSANDIRLESQWDDSKPFVCVDFLIAIKGSPWLALWESCECCESSNSKTVSRNSLIENKDFTKQNFWWISNGFLHKIRWLAHSLSSSACIKHIIFHRKHKTAFLFFISLLDYLRYGYFHSSQFIALRRPYFSLKKLHLNFSSYETSGKLEEKRIVPFKHIEII